MSIPTREAGLTIAQGYVAEHDCPYAERLIRIGGVSAIGTRGVDAYRLSHFVEDLKDLHAPDGSCPTTHVDLYPTTAWADWVQDTVV